MTKRNSLPIKPLLWILVVLAVIAYWVYHPAKHTPPSSLVTGNSPANSSLQPLGVANMQNQNSPSGQGPAVIARSQQNNPSPAPTGNVTAPNTSSSQENISENNSTAPVSTTSTSTVANPIPSDAQVLQRIAQRNGQQAQMYATLAARGTLAQQVDQEALASKYQTVNYKNIPSPTMVPPSASTIAKINSHQLGVTH